MPAGFYTTADSGILLEAMRCVAPCRIRFWASAAAQYRAAREHLTSVRAQLIMPIRVMLHFHFLTNEETIP